MLVDQLQELGLTEGEAKTYESLVALGPSKVGPIVKRSGIAYSNIYEVLNRLEEKGLVTHILKERTKLFSAAPPHRIQEYLERRQDEVEHSKDVLAKMLPALSRLHEGEDRLEAEVFVGNKGLMTAFDVLYADLQKGDETVYFYVHEPAYLEYAYAFFQKLWPRMRAKGLKARGISDLRYKKTLLSKGANRVITERFVDFPLPGTIDIVKGKVLITTWGSKPVGILIHSEQVAQNFRSYFEAVWKIAKR